MTSNPLLEYFIDAAQRSALFLDVMRERGNQYLEHESETVPHVLSFEYELLMSGLDLPKPVNYVLVRIPPVDGRPVDPTKRPFVVIDPRAGHGPGIGGFKADSEIGVAMAAGHPCYFIGFAPRPVDGQTIEDVMKAEVAFIEHVVSLHPEAEGKPTVIGNCQAGWAVMMLAAYRPDLCGPVILAGAPLTYWNGVRGENPMRYSGGILGGAWLTALTGDLGGGRFDGAWLVSNFEGMNPANTLWTKQYNVYANVDTERDRYLGFEKWWGGHVILNAEEMQFIVDNLFVGNRLPMARVTTSDGVALDYRAIQSPIICFCSKGDNITPPAQALGWILDLYQDVNDIQACGQTIVYAVHPSVGHLGIFVSGGVAKKEHNEFATNIDFIDCLPPGLYEAVLAPKSGAEADAELVATDYIARFEARTLDDIRAYGENSRRDERMFEAVSRLSDMTTGAYKAAMSPLVRAMVTPKFADVMMQAHPARLGYRLLSDENPAMRMIKMAADSARAQRQPASRDNPFWAAQEMVSQTIVTTLDAARDARDAMIEAWFIATFGNPAVQASLGLRPDVHVARRRPGEHPDHRALIARKVQELSSRMTEGGVREAVIRSLIYVGMPLGAADERRFTILKHIRDEQESDVSLSEFKQLVREQFFMLLIDEERAFAALPTLLSEAPQKIDRALEVVRSVARAGGEATAETEERLTRIEAIFRTASRGGAEIKTLETKRVRRPA